MHEKEEVGSDAVEEPEAKDFTFSVSLYGGRLATVRIPVPITKPNLERLKRMIEEQREPRVDDTAREAPDE